MSYTYTTFKTAIAELMVVSEANADFIAIFPSIIDYAEQRCYRELDLLSTRVVNSSQTLTQGSRSFAIPGNFIVVEDVSIISPAGQTPDSGSRVRLIPVARSYVDMVFDNPTIQGVPSVFAMTDNASMIVGPTPDGAYVVEIYGTVRPAPLSASNPTTFLSTVLPDLFLATAMVFASGFQQNFGAQADNPQMGSSWEGQCQKLMASANVEQLRSRFFASAWSSIQQAPTATPPRV